MTPTTRPASDKQINYLHVLLRERGVTGARYGSDVHRVVHLPMRLRSVRLDSLSAADASELIDRLLAVPVR